jgi:putative peptidoglycan lipid II flippase
MTKSLYKKVGIASLIMAASIFLSRLTGLFREMVIASIGGAGSAVDAYQIAFVIPEILNHVLASGFLSVTFIPIFSVYLAHNKEDAGWKVFSIILTCFGSLLSLFIIIAFFFAPQLVKLIAPGLQDPETMKSAVRLTRIIMPAQLFFFAGGLLMAVQFSREKFFIPALAPLVYNIGIISGGLLLGPRLGMEGFAWGVLLGSFAGNFLIQIMGALSIGMRFRPVVNFRHPDLKKYLLLTLPLMLGLTMMFSTEFFIKYFGSYLPPGSIASLNYALRVMLILVGLFGQAAGVASFPFMAGLAARGRFVEMNRLLNNTLRYLALVIPFSVLLMVLRHEVVLILFQRNRFDAADTLLTSQILVFLLVGTFAFAAQTVVVRGYYAMQETLFPSLFGTLAVCVTIPLYFFGIKTMGVCGVGLAVSLAAIFQVTLLYWLWNRRSGNRESRGVYLFYVKMMGLSVLLGLFLEWCRSMLSGGIDSSKFSGSLLISGVISVIFLTFFMGMGSLFKIDEVRGLLQRLHKRVCGTKVSG